MKTLAEIQAAVKDWLPLHFYAGDLYRSGGIGRRNTLHNMRCDLNLNDKARSIEFKWIQAIPLVQVRILPPVLMQFDSARLPRIGIRSGSTPASRNGTKYPQW